jgi:oligopeptide/dipeptide ABC transporter ATP-binding protein
VSDSSLQVTRSKALLAIEGLTIAFPDRVAIRDLTLGIAPGEILGLVGESGSGKTVLSLSILRLAPPTARISGKILWRGEDICSLPERRIQRLRGREIGLVFQGAQAALHPLQRIGDQLVAVIRLHQVVPRAEAATEARRLLSLVQIDDPDRRFSQYPRELSGGMCQRAMIALAIAARPSLLIADEPTSSLDVTVQHGILALLRDLRSKLDMAIVLISHDLGAVAEVCDRVAVIYRGVLVEEAPTSRLFASPGHPYTQLLLDSVPRLPVPASVIMPPTHDVTELTASPGGCVFLARCLYSIAACSQEPELHGRDTHRVACWVREADPNKD